MCGLGGGWQNQKRPKGRCIKDEGSIGGVFTSSRRQREPELHWLDKSIATYYSDVAYSRNVNYDFIIGHVPYLTNGCLNLKDIFVKRGVSCTAILVVHELPRKEDGTIDKEQLRELADADVLLFMRKSITTNFFPEIYFESKKVRWIARCTFQFFQ